MKSTTNNFSALERAADATETVEKTENDVSRDAALSEILSKPIRENKEDNALLEGATQHVRKIDGVVIGSVVETNSEHGVGIDYPGNPSQQPLRVTSIIAVGKHDIGKEVALVFEGGDLYKPILMGFIQHPEQTIDNEVVTEEQSDKRDVTLDGKRLEFKAENEIVLSCGKSSITLTRAGKIVIRGEYLLNRSTGVNKIKGGSVQIN